MHTKGKWICKKNTDGSWVVMSGDIVVAVFNRKDHPEWNESNARLIAAAPELLEACKVAEIVLRQGLKVDKDGNPENNQSHRAWKIANAAIEAAESEV